MRKGPNKGWKGWGHYGPSRALIGKGEAARIQGEPTKKGKSIRIGWLASTSKASQPTRCPSLYYRCHRKYIWLHVLITLYTIEYGIILLKRTQRLNNSLFFVSLNLPFKDGTSLKVTLCHHSMSLIQKSHRFQKIAQNDRKWHYIFNAFC